MLKFATISFYGVNPEYNNNPFTKEYVYVTRLTNLKRNDFVVVDAPNGITIGRFIGYGKEVLDKSNTFKRLTQKITVNPKQKALIIEKSKKNIMNLMDQHRSLLDLRGLAENSDNYVGKLKEKYNMLMDFTEDETMYFNNQL